MKLVIGADIDKRWLPFKAEFENKLIVPGVPTELNKVKMVGRILVPKVTIKNWTFTSYDRKNKKIDFKCGGFFIEMQKLTEDEKILGLEMSLEDGTTRNE